MCWQTDADTPSKHGLTLALTSINIQAHISISIHLELYLWPCDGCGLVHFPFRCWFSAPVVNIRLFIDALLCSPISRYPCPSFPEIDQTLTFGLI